MCRWRAGGGFLTVLQWTSKDNIACTYHRLLDHGYIQRLKLNKHRWVNNAMNCYLFMQWWRDTCLCIGIFNHFEQTAHYFKAFRCSWTNTRDWQILTQTSIWFRINIISPQVCVVDFKTKSFIVDPTSIKLDTPLYIDKTFRSLKSPKKYTFYCSPWTHKSMIILLQIAVPKSWHAWICDSSHLVITASWGWLQATVTLGLVAWCPTRVVMCLLSLKKHLTIIRITPVDNTFLLDVDRVNPQWHTAELMVIH